MTQHSDRDDVVHPAAMQPWTTEKWREDARCAETDPELFFPDKGGSTSEAKAICRGCLVRAECLIAALDNHEVHGIWGGLSPRERKTLARKHGIEFEHRKGIAA